jgi:hypothetical protein
MAYLRKNCNFIELVHSRRVKGKPRTLILHRFNNDNDLDDPKIQKKILSKLKTPLDFDSLNKKASELFRSINTTNKAGQQTHPQSQSFANLPLEPLMWKCMSEMLSSENRPEILYGKGVSKKALKVTKESIFENPSLKPFDRTDYLSFLKFQRNIKTPTISHLSEKMIGDYEIFLKSQLPTAPHLVQSKSRDVRTFIGEFIRWYFFRALNPL